jgi:hypothetical protein
MRLRLLAAILLATPATLAIADNPVHHRAVQRNVKHKATHSSATHSAGMDTERATQIQTALIKQGYLSGEPSGVWDSQSIAAMQKLQLDNGWQTKITPDSRALIKLGLGSQPTATHQATAPAQPAQ